MNPPRRTWNRRLATTKDGSPTLEVVEWGVAYHSIHGALTESMHVFIARGLERWLSENAGNAACLRVLEVGFGTGLNAALAWQWAERRGVTLEYVGLEPYPLDPGEAAAWVASGLPEDLERRMRALHEQSAGPNGYSTDGFSAHILRKMVQDWNGSGTFDVCFFDAFAPTQQPELWEAPIFESLLQRMNPGAVLATYCAKGQVRRNMEGAGWKVERHPGPPGKREMLVASNVPVSHWNVRCYALILNPARTHILVARERFPDGSVGCKFPGGGVEPGEALVDTLWRECAEELGSTEGLTWLGHAYTNDFFVRSAFREDEQILAVYHWMQADDEGVAWWDEKPSTVAASEPLLEMNWEALTELTPNAMRFPIDRYVVSNLKVWLATIQSGPSAG